MVSLRSVVAVLCGSMVYTILVFHLSLKHRSSSQVGGSTRDDEKLPALFIFRRTRKTGSSSMVEALLSSIASIYNYSALPFRYEDINRALRLEYVRRDGHTVGRRVMVIYHNDITRSYHPSRDAVIADTVRDGFEQITSYCRHIRGVRDCGPRVEACMRSNSTQKQMTYRWAGRLGEDDDTYIDLPLSSAHAMLSTAVLRTVYPNLPPLQLDYYNVRNSSCANSKQLRDVYDTYYTGLDEQVDELKRRILHVAGYPTTLAANVRENLRKNISVDDLLDAAELQERKRTKVPPVRSPAIRGTQAENVMRHIALQRKWAVASNGSLYPSTRGETEPMLSKIARSTP